MIEIFIELTNQIFWEGYAEQLAQENPAAFQMELAEFSNFYNPNYNENTNQIKAVANCCY
jgi:hypothetical protein